MHRILMAIGLVLAIAMIVIGTTVNSQQSQWAVYVGAGLFLLSGLPVVRDITERNASGKKVSHRLVALSSVAILAVYAAGYDRTTSAANRFDAQATAPRRRAAATGTPSAKPTLAAAALARNARAAVDAPATRLSSATPESASAAPVDRVDAVPALTAAYNAEATPAIVSESAALSSPAATPNVTPSAPAANVTPAANIPTQGGTFYSDGTYTGWGTCIHGDIQVTLVIKDDFIYSDTITKCLTRYSCSVIDRVPPQLLKLQDPDRIDSVTGATQSVDAYYWAVVDALKKAEK